jgi:hypothetical protein
MVGGGDAAALEHQEAEIVHGAELVEGNGAVGEGDGEFGEDTIDFFGGDHGAGGRGEFAGEIGGAKAAVGGVGMRVAKAVASRMSGEGAAASIGKGEATAG